MPERYAARRASFARDSRLNLLLRQTRNVHRVEFWMRSLAPRGSRIHSLMKRALITGLTGHDGSYLADLLLKKGTRSTGLSGARAPLTRTASTICTRILTSRGETPFATETSPIPSVWRK